MSKSPHKYQAKNITVTWDSNTCIHAAVCISRLPMVFDTSKRPWIQPENEEANDIIKTIKKCPSGALQFEIKKDIP